MSYRYDTPYNDYSHTKYALPPSKIKICPDSAAAQLGYTEEDMVEILADQERWYREEYQSELEAETQHQQQHFNNTQSLPAPTTHLKPKLEVYKGHRIANEHPIAATSHDNDNSTFERGDSPAAWYQPTATILEDAQAPPSPPEHNVGTTMVDHDMHTASFEHHDQLNNRAAQAEPNHCDRATHGQACYSRRWMRRLGK